MYIDLKGGGDFFPQANWYASPDPRNYRSRDRLRHEDKVWWNQNQTALDCVWSDDRSGQALFIGGSDAADVAHILHANNITHKVCVAGTESDADIRMFAQLRCFFGK